MQSADRVRTGRAQRLARRAIALLAVGAAPAWPGAAADEPGESPSEVVVAPRPGNRISRATVPIKIDGDLDESGWAGALRTTLDYEWFPGENVPPPVETEVFLAYDDDNLYVGWRAHDPDPAAVRAHLMDRDDIDTFVQDDHVLLMIDTFNDERRAFQFRVNPLGVQADAIFSQLDGIEDFSWDVIWDSAGRLTERGYEVEVAIPMNQIRFPAGTSVQTWGFDIGRSYPRSDRHRIANTPRDRSNSCLLCQTAKVEGFQEIEAGRNLVVTPTLTGTRTDEREDFPDGSLEEGDEEGDPGLTVRWGVTPNYTLDATLNPDFSQVEADVAQLDVNERFALFFPEKRPFFLEGVDFFSTLIDGVFTRTVADPDWGGKFTGKQGKNAIGVFATDDTINNLTIPSNQSSALTSVDEDVLGSVVRYRRDVGESSTLGVLYAGRESDSYHNRVAGLDGFLRFSETDTVNFQYLRSETLYPLEVAETFDQPTEEFDDGALEILYSHEARDWSWFARWRDFDPGFRADFGFVPRVDLRRGAAVLNRNFYPKEGSDTWWTRQLVGIQGIYLENHEGQKTDESVFGYYEITGPLQSYFYTEVARQAFSFDGVQYDGLDSVALVFEIQPTGRTSFEVFALVNETIDYTNNRPADQLLLEPGIEVKLGRHLNLQLDHTLQRLEVDGGRLFDANLSQLRLVYQFNVRTFVRAIVQYTDIERNPELYSVPVEPDFEQAFTQFLFSYKINPQTVVFVGYSENRLGTQDYDLTQSDRTLFVKLSYAWVV
jgi:hypothetical protein